MVMAMDTPPTPTAISEPTTPTHTHTHTHEDLHSLQKAQTAIESLSSILPNPPSLFSYSNNPVFSLLHDPDVASQISSLLRHPNSGSGDNHLCRWLYDTFQSSDPNLQLVVLRFIPIITGVYLSRRKPLAGMGMANLVGFETVLLAVYGSETASRAGQAATVSIPDLSHSSIYHEMSKSISCQNNSTELNMAIISPSLEPYGTVRSTRRERIVGVALELYFTKISQMPVASKIDFCEFCEQWAGQDGGMYKNGTYINIEEVTAETGEARGDESNPESTGSWENVGMKEGRIPLPWELLQPVLRILGHCLMGAATGNNKDKQALLQLQEAACSACRSVYARSMHDVNPRAILATGSLLRLGNMAMLLGESTTDHDTFDPTDIPSENLITQL